MITLTSQYPLLPRKAPTMATEGKLNIAEYWQQCCIHPYKRSAQNQRFVHIIKACQKLSRVDISKLGAPNLRTR